MNISHPRNYWSTRYQNHETGWDIGFASPALITYAQQLTRKDLKILIPGCGNAHEAIWLAQNGFSNITLIDIAPQAIAHAKLALRPFKGVHFIEGDFFELNQNFDLVLEQTFFCALSPALRAQYVEKMYELLTPSGKIAGLLFNTIFEKQGPPFGGSINEYQNLFSPKFNIKTMALCYNSIPARAEREVFIIFEKMPTSTN